MLSFYFAALALLGSAAASPMALHRRDGCTASWNGTDITGVQDGSACRYTIRYANAGRWEYPIAAQNQTGVNAAEFPAQCAQPVSGELVGALAVNQPVSEDCHFLTFYTPMNATKDSKLPIFYWIHGGSYVGGSESDKGLNGSSMASTSDIIVVFTQYRLGILGWLPPKVAPTAGDPNYALKDIVTSLEVIRDNVGAFGGDPAAVTVGGQSAGASMTRTLWGTPSSKGLFRGMIMHSDPINFGTQSPNQTAGLQELVYGNSTTNCTDFQCWQNADLNTLLTVSDKITSTSEGPTKVKGVTIGEVYRPSFGTVTLPQDPVNALFYNNSNLAFDIATMPLMITTTRNESGYLIEEALKTNITAIPALVNISLNEFVMNQTQVNAIMDSGAYPILNSSDSLRQNLETTLTDAVWRCASRTVGHQWAAAGGKLWMGEWHQGVHYTFDNGSYCLEDGVVCHGDDVYGTFNSGPSNEGNYSSWEPVIHSYWTSFIKSGDPTAGGQPWTQWTSTSNASDVNNLGGGFPMKECPADLWGTKVPWYWQAYSNESISTLGEGNKTAVVGPAPSAVSGSDGKKSGTTGLAVSGAAAVGAAMVALLL